MTVLSTIPNGALNKDIRDTINALLVDVAALKAGSGTVTPTPTPTPTPTINNTASESALLPDQVDGATQLFTNRETRLAALETKYGL